MTEVEQYYADLNDQSLKNMAQGLFRALVKEKMPESAAIVQELINRMRTPQDYVRHVEGMLGVDGDALHHGRTK